jgi:hypothetical protein
VLPPSTPSPSNPQPAAEIRISTLVGDRLCIRCGYNLVGQPIVREGHYNMLIVRCPECATVASVQEYPLLGRWANRWAALLAGLWLLVLVALWIGAALAIFGFSIGSAEIAAIRFNELITDRFAAWQAAQALASTQPNVPPAAGTAQAIVTGSGQVVYVSGAVDFATWWKSQDKLALLADSGGWRSVFSWWVIVLWFWMAVMCVALGCMWATVLLARGRRSLLVVGLIIVATSALFGSIQIVDWLTSQPNWVWNAAQSVVGPPMMVGTLLWGLAWLCTGLMIGRPVTRGLITLLLPPRMRGSLAGLWLTDGLEPPTSDQRRSCSSQSR